MKNHTKTLLLSLASMGLVACGGSAGGGDFGGALTPAPRTHVCPTQVRVLAEPFFKPDSSEQYASGALFTHDGGVEGVGAFVDSGTVAGVALVSHKPDDYLASVLESGDHDDQNIRFKRYLVARFRANDFDVNTVDIGQLAYVYLAQYLGSDHSDNSELPGLFPLTTGAGTLLSINDQRLVAYSRGNEFRYTTEMIQKPDQYVASKEYLKRKLNEFVYTPGATTETVRSSMRNELNVEGYLGFNTESKNSLNQAFERFSQQASACQEGAYEVFRRQFSGDGFVEGIGSPKSTVKEELAHLERVLSHDDVTNAFDAISIAKIRTAAYHSLCPEENRLTTYIDQRIDDADWGASSSEADEASAKDCLNGPFVDIFSNVDAYGNSIPNLIDQYSNHKQAWIGTINQMRDVWMKVYYEENCSGYDSPLRNDYSHHKKWFDAIRDGNSGEMKDLMKVDVDQHPNIRELVWEAETGSDGYLKGCFNGTQDWPETSAQQAQPGYTLSTLHGDIAQSAERLGDTCADRAATVITMLDDLNNFIDTADINDPRDVVLENPVYEPHDRFVDGSDHFRDASLVFTFDRALRCQEKNSQPLSEADACPISRDEAMEDLSNLVADLRLQADIERTENQAMSLVPLHQESTVADVLETAYRSTIGFIDSVNMGQLNLSRSATGRAIGDACIAHLQGIVDWQGIYSPQTITKLNLQGSELSKDAFLALVREIYAAKESSSGFSLEVIDATDLGISIDTNQQLRFADGSGLEDEDEEIFKTLFGYASDGKIVLLVDGGQLITIRDDIEVDIPLPE